MIRRLVLPSERDWLFELRSVGADPGAWERVRVRSEVVALKVGPFSAPAANILKQCMLSAGGDAIVSRGTVDCSSPETFAILIGTPKHFRLAADSLYGQPFGLSALGGGLVGSIGFPDLPTSLQMPGKSISWGSGPIVMGVLNVTPDSFSEGGLYSNPARAVERAMEMLGQGASIIDVGGESTRPGSSPVPARVQCERLLRGIPGICERAPGSVVSVDTSNASVAEPALDCGASIINDVTALSDPRMAALASSRGVPLILMHMKGIPADMQDAPFYDDVTGEVYSFLEQRIGMAEAAGMGRDRVLVDPGIGFGKRLEDNLDLLRRLGEFRGLGCRTVVGHSRKSFLGAVTGEKDPAARDAAGHAVAALVCGTADIIRVHDVRGTVQVLAAARALSGRP
jgi:dihydropteroate synthase